ncbi:MAG TPA: flavin reductase family protein [Mycobacteriales bacterium]|nr:flavin reductase family protein [Mycobacteriales bacterium]
MDAAARSAQDAARPASQVDARRYRDAVGRFPTGVTVVTAHRDGLHHGMTANSFTSVSLDPVLVLACVDRSARLHDLVLAAGAWGVSVLAADAAQISAQFASRGRAVGEALAAVPHHFGPLTGAALLDDALVTLECRTTEAYSGGDHTILLGEVLDLTVRRPDTAPLVFYRGEYHSTDW